MKKYRDLFNNAISAENLFLAWNEFRRGKTRKSDVQQFEWKLEQNIFQLHRDLVSKRYHHGPYHDFYISDPKPRHIHKATVRDRVVHHAVVTVLSQVYEPTFIADSFSRRKGKGSHKGVFRVQQIVRQVSKNGTGSCFALKCDVKKFFDTVNHNILLGILAQRIKDADFMWLLAGIIESYECRYIRERERES